MPQPDYSSWLVDVRSTDKHYKNLFSEGPPNPPIFFFGDPENAVAATLGVNPSAQEFSLSRRWQTITSAYQLFERCKNYFEQPSGVPPHPWFKPWEIFLQKIGISYYKNPRAIHLDISPRATRSMGNFQSNDEIELFLSLAKMDLKYLFDQLKYYPKIRHLYAAGAITKKYYLIEFLEKYAHDKCSFSGVIPFMRGGSGKTALYYFDLGDNIKRYLFFCSSSPSSLQGKDILPQKVSWLKKYPEFIPNPDS